MQTSRGRHAILAGNVIAPLLAAISCLALYAGPSAASAEPAAAPGLPPGFGFPTTTAADGAWTDLDPAPQARAKHAAVVDGQGRMIVFGGACLDPCCSDGAVPNDLWMLTLDADVPRWVEVRPSGTPPPAGLGPAAIYDPVRERMLVPGASGAVFQLSLSAAPAWSEIVPAGTPPPNVSAAVYDVSRDEMLAIASTGRVFQLALAVAPEWVELLPTGRLPTRIAGALYDPLRDRVVVFGDSIRALSLGASPAWSWIAPPRPQFLTSYSIMYDAPRDRAVIHGGCRTGNCGTTETWALSLADPAAWSGLSSSGPLLSSQSAIYDPGHERMVLFGGYAKQVYTEWMSAELWTMSLTGATEWTDVTPPAAPAACRAPAILDTPRGRMVVVDDSVRVLSLSALPAWSTLAPSGTPPARRSDYSTIYDPVRERMILHGGWQDAGGAPVYLQDLWELSLTAPESWTQLAAAGTPPPAAGPAVYDALRDRMLVIGAGGVWELPLFGSLAWAQVAASGTPPNVTSGYGAVLDPAGDRVIVFGGDSPSGFQSTTWQLALSPEAAWSTLAVAGTPPAARAGHVAILDAARGRMVIAGGDSTGPAPARDAWAMSLGPTPTWSPLDVDGEARGGTGVYDAARDRLVALAACDTTTTAGCSDPSPRAWALSFQGFLDTPTPRTAATLTLAQSRPNPAGGPVSIPFSIPRAAFVTLRVYDLSGRIVARLVDRALPAGDHVARWSGARIDGGRARAGTYFYDLRADGQRQARTMILLH